MLASIAFARRLNPPVVRDEAAVKDPQDGQEEVTDSIIRKPPDTDIKTPPLATPKFELIGTVVCEDLPEKSMALIKLSNGKWQWFQKGQQLGHHLLGDIRNGRAFIRQNGKTTEFVVPEKPRGQQLVRGDSL